MKSEIQKILIKTPNWLGDSVMSIPAVIGVKKLFPEAEVCVWTKPWLAGLWKFVPEVNRVIESRPKKYDFNLGILFTNSFGSAFRMFLAGVPNRRGYAVGGRSLLLTQPVSLKIGWDKLHEVEYFLGIIEEIGRVDIEPAPKISVPVKLQDGAKNILRSYGWNEKFPVIGVHATASYGPAKRWRPDRFSELMDKLIDLYDAWVVVIGNSREIEDIKYIIKNVANRRRVINMAGNTSIENLAGTISLCRIFIANDSGPMHLAAALGIPVAAIFGSTDPSLTGPRGMKCVIVQKYISCNPCFRRECKKGSVCMSLIGVEDVINAVKTLMSETLSYSPLHFKKLAIVMKDYDEKKGGAERYLAGLVPKLAGQSDSIDLIVNRVNGEAPLGVNIKRVKALRWSSILAPLSFNLSVRRLLKKNNYNAVYGLTQIYPLDVYRVGGGLEHSWFEIRNKELWRKILNYLQPRNIVRFYIENKIFRKGNYKKIITNSNLCKDQILHHYNVSPEDVTVVYNGVDMARFDPAKEANILYRDVIRLELGIPEDDKVVLFMSNNWKRKGLVELLRAFGAIKNKNIWLVVAGRGKQQRYKKLAAKLGVGNRTRFIGPTGEPEKLYTACDVFVLPTYYDPCANVCIEAISCGLPVITTRTNGAAELIVEGRNGFVINEPDEINEMALCIKKAITLDRKNIRDTIKDLTAEKNVEKTLEVLNSIKSSLNPPFTKGGVGGFSILVNDGYRELLEKKGWLNFDNVMEEKEGVLYKKNKLRSVVKTDLDGRNVFLKRHYGPRLLQKACRSWAFKEWQNIFRLKSLGIQTMNPVAVGEREDKSFIITESLESCERLEDLVRTTQLNFEEKKKLIYKLAVLVRRLHKNNLFHKDFYTGHVFVKRGKGELELYFIDLQRLCGHWLFQEHWRIKDIASLDFSSRGYSITNTDRMRFLKYYLGDENIWRYREFLKSVKDKTESIARHTEKILKRRKNA